MFGDKRMTRKATQNINGSTRDVVVFPNLAKERSRIWICQSTPGIILVECPLQGPEQQIAFGSIGVNDSQSRIRLPIRRSEGLAALGDVDHLTSQNEELSL